MARLAGLLLLTILLCPASTLVKDGGALLRTGCLPDDDRIAALPPGHPVEIRYGLSGSETPCYKVRTQIDGAAVEGWLTADALDGLDAFDRKRRSAAEIDVPRVIRAEVESIRRSLPAGSGAGPMMEAVRLIESRQPRQALAVLEGVLGKGSRDPEVLALAGLAAYQNDNPRQAIEYWRESLELRPSAPIQQLYRKAERELAADVSSQKLHGMRFVLRYDGAAVEPAVAQQMVQALDEEYARISFALGCRAEEQITAIVQTREAYLKSTDAAEWSGGLYDGRIRVALMEHGVGARTRRTFAHEIVHACLAAMGHFPSWLHEGLAQKHSGESLSPALLSRLKAELRNGAIPRLGNLSQTWSRLSTQHAALAYASALAAVETMYRDFGDDYVRNLLRNPELLPQLTAELERRLVQ
ncbi:MAG: tetratricopeptide repeat protein [Bryobacteraceae bacterium]